VHPDQLELPLELRLEVVELSDAFGDGLAAAFTRHGLELVEVVQSLRLDFAVDAGVATGEEAA
jgi:hypothetical protein